MAFKFMILALAILVITVFSPVSGQTAPTCTPAMITTFMPCINFTTNNSLNGTAPSADCCNSLKSLMSNGKDCLCLITTGGIPFQIPVNRTLAVSLPRACNMPGVPLQCKAAGAPAPAPALAPGPEANGPSVSPSATPSPSATGLAPPEALSPTSPPGADATPTATPTPPTPTTTGSAPGSNTGSRAGVSPLHLVAAFAAVALKFY